MQERIVSAEPSGRRRQDTTRSWRAAKTVLVRLLATAAAAIGFVAGYSSGSDGDRESAIAEFESSLKNFIRVATQHRLASLPLTGFWAYEVESAVPPQLRAEAEQLSNAANQLNYHNERRAKAVFVQTVAEYNFAHSHRDADLRIHNDSSLSALQGEWQITSTSKAVWRGLWVGFLCGAVAWGVGWWIIVALAFIWWFLMDRLRDIAGAVRGNS